MLVLGQRFCFYMVYTVVLDVSYEIKICLSLNDFMFSCSFHVFLNNFFVPRVDDNKRGGFQISNVESTLSEAQRVCMAPLSKLHWCNCLS